jgi:hypothetical protein
MSYEYSSGMWQWIGLQAPQTIIMPPYLVVGDQWVFQRVIGEYSGYTGGMTFAAGTDRISATATVNDEFFTWTFPSSATSGLTPQPYLWTATMTDPSGSRYTIQSGGIQVLGDISANAPCTTQTMLQQQLAACDQTLLKLLSQEVQTVAFAGQTYTLHNVKDLFAIRNSLANRVAQEQAQLSGNSRSNRILPRFVFR